MNSFIERWVKTFRAELLERTMIWNQTHLRCAPQEYERHYNEHRTHRSLAGAAPLRGRPQPLELDQIERLSVDRQGRLGHRHNVDWVMSGSVVLAVYGADVQPNDLDVVPSPDPDNLQRIADLLVELEAIPAYDPSWRNGLTEERCRSWRPEPLTLAQLDHLFVTRLGMLDVPPELTGTYAHLRTGATELELAGTPVWVCDPHEVLKRVPDPPRPKDLARADACAELREQLQRDSTPLGLAPFA